MGRNPPAKPYEVLSVSTRGRFFLIFLYSVGQAPTKKVREEKGPKGGYKILKFIPGLTDMLSKCVRNAFQKQCFSLGNPRCPHAVCSNPTETVGRRLSTATISQR